eukprot:10956758-Alexandrium_andersonii.AAC.1
MPLIEADTLKGEDLHSVARLALDLVPQASDQGAQVLHVYTDGSCEQPLRGTPPTHAASAFAVVAEVSRNTFRFVGAASARITPDQALALGADYLSNNTAEFVALLLALSWVARECVGNGQWRGVRSIVVHTDSEFTMHVAQGKAAAAAHTALQAMTAA